MLESCSVLHLIKEAIMPEIAELDLPWSDSYAFIRRPFFQGARYILLMNLHHHVKTTRTLSVDYYRNPESVAPDIIDEDISYNQFYPSLEVVEIGNIPPLALAKFEESRVYRNVISGATSPG